MWLVAVLLSWQAEHAAVIGEVTSITIH